MFLGALDFVVLLGDVRSLKQKRSVVRPVIAELQRFGVCAVEGGDQDLHRRSQIGVAAASSGLSHLTELLDRCERVVAGRPELELLSARRRIVGPQD